jgi:hypothetical protein
VQRHKRRHKKRAAGSGGGDSRSKLLLLGALRAERVAREGGERMRAKEVLAAGARCGG